MTTANKTLSNNKEKVLTTHVFSDDSNDEYALAEFIDKPIEYRSYIPSITLSFDLTHDEETRTAIAIEKIAEYHLISEVDKATTSGFLANYAYRVFIPLSSKGKGIQFYYQEEVENIKPVTAVIDREALKPEARTELWNILNIVFGESWQKVLNNSEVAEIQYTISAQNVDLNDLSVSSDYKYQTIDYVDGTVSTITFSEPQSQTKLVIKHTGRFSNVSGIREYTPHTNFTWTEAPHIKLSDITNLKNQGQRISVYHSLYPLPDLHVNDKNLVDAARAFGIDHVLKRYSKQTASGKKVLLQQLSRKPFNFKKTWSSEWPKTSKRFLKKLTKQKCK